MVVSTARWTRSTTARIKGTPRGRTAGWHPVRTTGGAEWVPARTTPRPTVARFVRAFNDDRKLIGLKLLMLAAILIATAVLDWAV